MIRPISYDDIPALIELGKEAHAQSDVWQVIEFDARVLRGTLARAINDKNCWAYVNETKGKIDGVMIGLTHQAFFSTDKMATDLWTYANRAGAGAALLRGFTKWAKGKAALVMLGVSNKYNSDESKKIYERVGLKRAGGVYAAGGDK